jgi:Protein of unknown function (DUF1822)
MLSSTSFSNEFRVLLPEGIWLEPDHFEQARALSHSTSSESLQWQTYVNALAFLGFSQWLDEKMPDRAQSAAHFIEGGCLLRVGEFKLCLLAVEHVLDEVIPIPTEAVFNPDLAAHFYVALEVCQEEEQVILRGMLRHDQLTAYLRQINQFPEGHYPIPLSRFDPEPNHLVSYCRYLDAAAIALPVSQAPSAENETAPSAFAAEFRESLHQTKTHLSEWLQDRVEEGWLAIDTLIHPEAYLALNTRNSELDIRKGKLLNLGLKLGQQSAALLVSINPEPEDKLNVLVQLHPTDGQRFLPPQIKLTLQSTAGETLQEVQARDQDNYIQLQSFKGSLGRRFSLKVSLLDKFVKEAFEL